MRTRTRSRAVAVAGVLLTFSGFVASGASAEPLVTVSVTGTLRHVVVDNEAGGGARGRRDAPTSTEPFLIVDGVLHALPAGAAVPPGPSGEDVVVTLEAPPGVSGTEALELADAHVASPRARVVEIVAVEAATADAVVGGATASAVLGTHVLTVLPVYWSAKDDQTTGTLAALANATAQYWNQQSAGRLTISPVVKPWAHIADPGSCDVDELYNDALAANPSVADPTLTKHVLVYFPYRDDCPFAGRAALLGGEIWVNGVPLVDVTAHEFGHNVGLGHANQRRCTSGSTRVPLSATCVNSEYADRADVMGFATDQASGNLNSAFADYLGFARVRVIPANLDGTLPPVVVQLAPLSQVTATRAVKIHVPAGDIYLDFRPAAGRDVRVPAWAGVQVHLRTTAAWNGPVTYQLDMQPTKSSAFAAPQLPVGATWAVPDTNLLVSVTSVGSTARIQIASTMQLEKFVTHVYQDLLGREPDAGGLRSWTNALRAGRSRVSVATSFTSCVEYRSALIRASYQHYLDRGPDAGGVETWLKQMARGMKIQVMEGGFLASQEYYVHAGGGDAAWVRGLYADVLGRTAAPAEVQYWVARVRAPGVGRYRVAIGFLDSTEHLGTVVNGHYQHLLSRNVDAGGRSSWVRLIQRGARIETVVGGIVASPEYLAKP